MAPVVVHGVAMDALAIVDGRLVWVPRARAGVLGTWSALVGVGCSNDAVWAA